MTVDGVWKSIQHFQIQLSQEKLNQWSEEGDLATLNPALYVMERDDANETVMADGSNASDTNNNPNTINNNADHDEGPAPLQSGIQPLETFDDIIDHTNFSIARCVNTEFIIADTIKVIEYAYERSDTDQLDDEILNDNRTVTNRTAIFQQTYVLPIDGFSDMNKITYRYASL